VAHYSRLRDRGYVINLPSLKPLNKVSAGTIAGLVTALILWALRKYAAVELDLEGTALITSLVSVLASSAAAYFTPLSESEVVQIVQSEDAPLQVAQPVKP
jgi:hypothetical protein